MPTGIYFRTKNYRKILSIAMTGRKLSKQAKEKVSKARKGKKLSKEHREKLRLAKIGHIPWNKGKPNYKGRGENCHLWKGGITSINDKVRTSIEYRLWREAVFSRDNWICQKTGRKGGELVAHHILNFSHHKELRFAIDNGITLSKKSHIEFHKIYGKKDNNLEQLMEYLDK